MTRKKSHGFQHKERGFTRQVVSDTEPIVYSVLRPFPAFLTPRKPQLQEGIAEVSFKTYLA